MSKIKCKGQIKVKEMNTNKENIFEDIDYKEIYDSLVFTNNLDLGPIFISKDGKYANLKTEHSRIFRGYEYEADDYYIMEDEFGLIKANGGNKFEPFPYIDLWTLPNSYQRDAIIRWIEFLQQKGRTTLQVNNGYFMDNYNLKEMTAKEIYTDIVRHFNMLEELSKQQELYFKDSKIRDAHGNLLVCYHGTNTPGFTEFDARKGVSQFGEYKFGNANVCYFTTDKRAAISYTQIGVEEDNNVYACYVNIVNPFIVNNTTTAQIKSSFNIKDDRLRAKEVQLFDSLWDRYNNLYLDDSDLEDINSMLIKLNYKLIPSRDRKIDAYYTKEDGYYDLYHLGNNSLFGGNSIVLYAYTLQELFDDNMYEELRETIIGEDEDDYFLSTDDVVRYVLELNADGEDYDGIVIEDIIDSKEMFAQAATDVITLKSSNQIKLINNENPTSSNRINEELITGQTGIFEVDVFVTDNAYSAKTKLYSLDVLSRIFIDDDLYLIADAWDITHTEMVSVAQQNGYNTKFNEFKSSQICLICAPIGCVTDYDERTDIIDDDYDTAYDYENFILYSRGNNFKEFDLYKVLGKPLRVRTLKESAIREAIKVQNIKPETCGYILDNGDLIQLDEYHGEESKYKGKQYPEYSNTHFEEDTCIRVFKEPTQEQYNRIEEIVDLYLSREEYCKLEIENDYYKIFSLFQGACKYPYGDERVGNWTGYDLVREIKNYYNNKNKEPLTESIVLDEATRNDLINKSRNADDYAKNNQSKGKNRYERRLRSRVSDNKATYNRIDMDALFKRDILTVGIEVHGETDDYIVTVRFTGVLRELQNLVKDNNGKLEYKVISKALARALNSDDLKVNCSCPDTQYRQRYYQWKNGYGTQVEPRPSNITNPRDTKGAGCKHTLLVLSNLDWIIKVASVLNNYIKYCQVHLQPNYATYMFPKIYGMPYNRAVQTNMFDTGLLPSDQKTLTLMATKKDADRDEKGRWVKGNSFRYASKKPPTTIDDGQLSFDDVEDTDEEELSQD